MKKSLRPLSVLCVFCIVISLAPAAYGQTPEEELEREAQAIDRMIMCPVCPAETIDQAQVEISFQMRAIIREMLAEGRSRQEILDYFADRYGPDILAAPPKSGANLLAWILPIAGVAAGLGALFLVIRAMTNARSQGREVRSERETTPSPRPSPAAARPDDPELSPYLEIVDRSLALRRGMRPAQGERPHPNPPPEGEGTDTRERPSSPDSRLRGNEGGGGNDGGGGEGASYG